MSEQSSEPGQVVHNADERRFEIHVDGRSAGVAEYVDLDGRRVFTHTEVGEDYSGRGLAGALVGHALDETVRDGLTVVGVCPYVAKYLDKHPEHSDRAEPVTPDLLRRLEQAR